MTTFPSELRYNDKTHAYYIDGARAKGVTTAAKIPDSTHALDKWKMRNVVVGMATTPALVERAAAHYDERDLLDEIAEEALQAARANEAATRGSAAHRITERHDLAEMVVDTPYSIAVRAAWDKAIADAGLSMLPQYVERIVLYPDLMLAGTFDRLATRRINGERVVVDLKTGENAIKYPHSMAIQMALYANAPIIAGKIPPGGGTTTDFAEMPHVNKSVGYVVHMPGDETTVQVHSVDIAAGWEAAQQIVFPTWAWRDRSDLIGTLKAEASVTPHADNIRARLGILKMVDGARDLVAARWPAGIAPRPPWNVDEGAAILAVLTRVELELGVPF